MKKSYKAGKNLKPYQGLKHRSILLRLHGSHAGKNLKPYQGLKLAITPWAKVIPFCRPEKT